MLDMFTAVEFCGEGSQCSARGEAEESVGMVKPDDLSGEILGVV